MMLESNMKPGYTGVLVLFWVLRHAQQEVMLPDAVQVGTLLESYEDADIPFFWFHSFGAFWVRLFADDIRSDKIRSIYSNSN